MSIYKFAETVKFEPWAEDGYANSSLKVLFVGESHYTSASEANNRNLTRDVVEMARKGELYKSSGKTFFTNVAALASGRILNEEEREAWWPQVAFYNYIQEPVGETARVYVDVKLFDEAHDAFHEVLNTLSPDVVVVLGSRVWRFMSAKGAKLEEPLDCVNVKDKFQEVWRYPTGNGKGALVFHVKHPSSGFNYRSFHPLYGSAMMRQAGGKKVNF